MKTVSEWFYVPPAGPLYDFDDSLVDPRDRTRTRRWLAGFNGRVGEPAENVQLGWRGGSDALVAVGTFHPRPHEDTERLPVHGRVDARRRAVPPPRAPLEEDLTGFDHLRQISQDDSLWTRGDLSVDATEVPCSWATVSGATIVHTDDGSVVVVSRGIPLERLRVRTLPQPAPGYPVDPRQPQATTALNAEWEAFFEDRPDLVPAESQPGGRR